MVLKELPYKVNDDEILILEEQLFNEYLTDIRYINNNNYYNVKNSYGFIKPSTRNSTVQYNLENFLNDDLSKSYDLSEEKMNESRLLKEKIKKLKSGTSKKFKVTSKRQSKMKL